MRGLLKGNVIVLVAETGAERAEIVAFGAVCDDHVFRLKRQGDKGCALHDLGPRATACREPLNVVSTMAEVRFRPIGNLAHTPFELHGEVYASVEGFWQGLKATSEAERRRIAGLHGHQARREGRGWIESATVTYRGQEVPVGRPDHWALMAAACFAKFRQNDVARAALLATGERPLLHRVKRDSRTIPGVVMAEIWRRVRDRLQREGRR